MLVKAENARRFWSWRVMTPLGVPVVPEVNKISEVSSGETASRALSSACCAEESDCAKADLPVFITVSNAS